MPQKSQITLDKTQLRATSNGQYKKQKLKLMKIVNHLESLFQLILGLRIAAVKHIPTLVKSLSTLVMLPLILLKSKRFIY